MNFFPQINLIIENHENISPQKFPAIQYTLAYNIL